MATLKRFVDTRSAAGWGAVAHAFAAGLRQLLADWSLFTAQLEHRALCGSLPLQVQDQRRFRRAVMIWEGQEGSWPLFTAQLEHRALCGLLPLRVGDQFRGFVHHNWLGLGN